MSGTGVGGAHVNGAGMSAVRAVGAAPPGPAGRGARWPARAVRRATADHRDRGRPPGGLVG
ncbi:hypothetical protein GCM10017688_20840 [Streptomyces ramulosus]